MGSSMRRQTAILDAYQLVLAILLFASPWLFAFAQPTAMDDAQISAAFVAVISGAALLAFREWEEWGNLALALWIAASPWLLGFQHAMAARVMFGVGAVIGYLALLELWLIHYGTLRDRAEPR
jgi:hypothetical protein